MMEVTPRTRNSGRYRRAPTPKLSERKKKLFQDGPIDGQLSPMMSPYVRLERLIIEEGEDSDIGPMSPLEFSSSPSSFNDVHRIIAREQKENAKLRRTNFSNIMSEISKTTPCSSPRTRSKSKQINLAMDNSNDSTERKDSSEEDVVGPLCTSMKKLTSMTEQNYEQQLKTPSEMTTSNKSSSDQMVARGASFRKSLVFDTGLTPHDNQSNASPPLKSIDEPPPKARTSLTFGEPVISVRSFYGKPIDKSDKIKPNHESDLIAKLNSHEFASAIAKRTVKLKPKSKLKSKSLTQRMKAPSLWRFSGKMKFNRHNRQRTQNDTKKKKLNTSTNRNLYDGKHLDNINLENVPPNGIEMTTSRIEQNLRLQKILKDQTNSLGASRDINWNGGVKQSNKNVDHVAGFANSDDDDDGDSDNENVLPQNCSTYEEVEVEIEEPTNRKFFKSKANNSAKKYRIMGKLSATIKRGTDLKFDPPPKRKKKRQNKDGEKVILHNEITSIIDRLSSPSKVTKHIINAESDSDEIIDKTNKVTEIPALKSNEPDFIDEIQMDSTPIMETVSFDVNIEQFRKMIPYNTNDPEKISQQESILELLITNGICNEDTFKIFIAEPDLHKEKASQILDSLYCVNTMMPDEYENEGTIEWINSPIMIGTQNQINIPVESNTNNLIETCLTSQIIIEGESNENEGISNTVNTTTISSLEVSTLNTDEVTTAIDIASPVEPTIASPVEDLQTEKLFPIFQKNFIAKDNKAPTFNSLNKTLKEWTPIGNQQYQLDVGQNEFGIRTCAQCEMQYSVHEPEDELLHLKYHNCVNILSFKGWNNERIVTQISDWGLNGRIIYICEADSKGKKDRVKEVLNMVDRDLGFAKQTELKPKTLVYFAIAKQQIVGVCVVQPLERAHRFKTENGVDCYTIETYPVRCGISRVWVAPQYRRHGIAAKLITSMRSHFLFGAFLSFDEIAFSSPTEDGKKFATKLTQRSDFLIYEQ